MKEITIIAFLFFGVVLIGYIIADLIKTWKEK
jgi:hypothetical protein